MSEHAAGHSEGTPAGAPHGATHSHTNYYKVWALLCGLLVVSVLGPFIGITWVTLVTAFGIAVVKAYLVATKFMHLNLEKKFVAYIVGAMVVLMLLMFGGVSPDVLKHEGARWSNDAAKAVVAKGLAEPSGHHGGGEHQAEKKTHEAEER